MIFISDEVEVYISLNFGTKITQQNIQTKNKLSQKKDIFSNYLQNG